MLPPTREIVRCCVRVMDAAWLFVQDLSPVNCPPVSPASAGGRWRKCAVRTICAVDSGVLSPEMSPTPAGASLDGLWAVLF